MKSLSISVRRNALLNLLWDDELFVKGARLEFAFMFMRCAACASCMFFTTASGEICDAQDSMDCSGDLWEGIDLRGGDSRCLRQSALPGFSLGTEEGNCSEGCKFVQATNGPEECRAIILASGCSTHFSYRASDGQCWGKASVGWVRRADAWMTSGPVENRFGFLRSASPAVLVASVAAEVARGTGFVNLQFLNAGFVEMTRSWICNVRAIPGVLRATVFIATDDVAFRALREVP